MRGQNRDTPLCSRPNRVVEDVGPGHADGVGRGGGIAGVPRRRDGAGLLGGSPSVASWVTLCGRHVSAGSAPGSVASRA